MSDWLVGWLFLTWSVSTVSIDCYCDIADIYQNLIKKLTLPTFHGNKGHEEQIELTFSTRLGFLNFIIFQPF